MADPNDDDIPQSTTWGAHMREIRRDLAQLVQSQTRTFELLGRFHADLNEVREEVAESRTKITAKLTQLSSDIIHLESQNISRHGETISLLNRLDRAGIPKSGYGIQMGEPVYPAFGKKEPSPHG